MKVVVPLVSVMLLGLVQAAPVRAQDAAAIVNRSARAYAATSSLRADFIQRIEDSMIGTYDSRGKLLQAGENKLSMRFTDPDGDAIIVDGRQVWVYTPSTAPGQVIRMPIPTGATYGLNVLSWILDRPSERYRMRFLRSDVVNGRAADVVELIPLSSELPIARTPCHAGWKSRSAAVACAPSPSHMCVPTRRCPMGPLISRYRVG